LFCGFEVVGGFVAGVGPASVGELVQWFVGTPRRAETKIWRPITGRSQLTNGHGTPPLTVRQF